MMQDNMKVEKNIFISLDFFFAGRETDVMMLPPLSTYVPGLFKTR